MTISAAKEKLHSFIDNADEQKIFVMLSFFDNDSNETRYNYSEETLNILRERSADYLSGKTKTYSVEESMEHVREHRKANGI